MFKLIAALFLVTGGTVAEQPSHVMTYNHSTFETEASCMEFMETETGRVVTTAISMAASGRGVVVRFGCIQAPDNTI